MHGFQPTWQVATKWPDLSASKRLGGFLLAVDVFNTTQLERCGTPNRIIYPHRNFQIKNAGNQQSAVFECLEMVKCCQPPFLMWHICSNHPTETLSLFQCLCFFAEIRTLKSSALLVFVWKPPHLLLDNKCFESSLRNHKTTRKPKWDREDERIKICAISNNRPFRPVQAMCTITSLRSGQKVGGSSSNSHGNWSAWQKTGNICSWRKKSTRDDSIQWYQVLTYHDGLK